MINPSAAPLSNFRRFRALLANFGHGRNRNIPTDVSLSSVDRLRLLMDYASALGVAAAASQFTEQVLKISDCLYQYFKSVKQAPAKSRQLRQEALLFSDVLETLTDVFSAQNKSSILPNALKYADMIRGFSETMTEMSKKVEIKKGELSFRRLAWPFTEKENEDYLAKMERFKSSFQLALQALQSYDLSHFVLTCQFKARQDRSSCVSNR